VWKKMGLSDWCTLPEAPSEKNEAQPEKDTMDTRKEEGEQTGR